MDVCVMYVLHIILNLHVLVLQLQGYADCQNQYKQLLDRLAA